MIGVQAARRRGRGHTPGMVNLAGAMIVTLIVAVLALRASPSTPPEIAEFAPTAHQQIKNAPPEQNSTVGKGPGVGNGLATPTPTPPPTAPAAAQAAQPTPPPQVNHCVGTPPRQIEDPQSPPCVPFWSGTNPGATYKGVTASTITVALPTSDGSLPQWEQDLATFFNERFEFYGRKIQLVAFQDPGNHADAPPESSYQSEATAVDQQIHAFASLNMTDSGGGEITYYDDLASEGIISVGSENVMREGEGHADAHAPYEWRLFPGFDVVADTYGKYVCTSLKGGLASHAGTGIQGKPRVFGMLVTKYTDNFAPDVSPITDELNACGITIADTETQTYDLNQCDSCFAQESQQVMLNFRQKNVTSILCVCHAAPMWLGDMPAAQSQSYFPEWVMSGYGIYDWDLNQQAFGGPVKQEVADEFGLSWANKSIPTNQLPIMAAIHEVDPTYNLSDSDAHQDTRDYLGMLMLASGIQMAGPNLTPQTFQAGLFKTQFPDPGADGPPYYQAEVGFGPSHSFFHSSSAIWWSNSDASTWGGGAGAFCWSDHGVRQPQQAWKLPDDAQKEPCY